MKSLVAATRIAAATRRPVARAMSIAPD